jgi:drug/metabolite transporter (DMT)-like permease
MNQDKLLKLYGYGAVLGSALFIYLSAVVIRWSEKHVELHPAFFLFSRYLLGFIVLKSIVLVQKRELNPSKHFPLIVGRTVTNCMAVFFLYHAVTTTTVAEANILNMTYPLFVAMITWIFWKDGRDPYALASVIVAWIGVYLILAPEGFAFKKENLWGLASGLSASLSILLLKFCREYDDSTTILYYMFGMGTMLIFVAFPDVIHIPSRLEFYYLFLCAGLGILGQYLLTLGFRFVTSVEGSVLSSSRILLAGILGPVIASDPHLGLVGWTGALLIFSANGFLAYRKTVAS